MLSLFPDGVSERELPPFRTLLIKGSYHPSAPIHLCLSHSRSQTRSKIILLTPSRSSFKRSLEEFNDDWLSVYSGHGKITELSSRIEVFYSPSPAHLELFLSMIRTYELSDGAQFEANTTLDTMPTLIVLHELSAYFLTPDMETSYTVSSYLSLVAQALASVTFLSAHNGIDNIMFALFDAQLDQLKLPIVRPPSQGEETERSVRLESVAGLVQKYFEWVGVFDKFDTASVGEGGSERERKNRLRLYETLHSNGNPSRILHWTEQDGPQRGSSDRRGTVFCWT